MAEPVVVVVDASVAPVAVPAPDAALPRATCIDSPPKDPQARGCHSNGECSEKPHGRCVTYGSNAGPPTNAPMNVNSCVYSPCASDGECAPPTPICACHDEGWANDCVPGECHDDRECPAGQRCQSEAVNYYKSKRRRPGRFCTTPEDTCHQGDGCWFCVRDDKTSRWTCDKNFVPPPG